MLQRLTAFTLLLPMLLVSGILADTASAQTLSSDRIFGEVDDDEFAALSGSEEGSRNVLLLLPTIPVTFNSLERDSTDVWRLGSAITGGVGLTLLLGKATYNGETSNVDPWLIGGVGLNNGIKDSGDGTAEYSLSGSVFVGIGDVAVSFARDFLEDRWSAGLSLKLDTLTNLAPDAFMCFSGCETEE
jgi:hypothetical protein